VGSKFHRDRNDGHGAAGLPVLQPSGRTVLDADESFDEMIGQQSVLQSRGQPLSRVWLCLAAITLMLLALAGRAEAQSREWVPPFPSGSSASNCHPGTPVECQHSAVANPVEGSTAVSLNISSLSGGLLPGRAQAWGDAAVRVAWTLDAPASVLEIRARFRLGSAVVQHSGMINSLAPSGNVSGFGRLRLILTTRHTACSTCSAAAVVDVSQGEPGSYELLVRMDRGTAMIPVGQIEIHAGVDAVASLDGLLPDNGHVTTDIRASIENISIES